MHDLVHDLAQSIMGQECMYLEKENMSNLSKSTHHISFQHAHCLSFNEGDFKKIESLRTLFQLKHYNDEELDYFPINHSLRVLRTPSFQLFPYIGKLTSLRTLSVYIVSLKTGHSLVELRDLNLGGKLNIVGLNNVGSLSEAKEANLIGKKDLYELCLSWYHTEELTEPPIISVEQVLEVLQPHSNLKRLKISYYEGLFLPSWISILSNLVALELRDCEKCVRLPSFGKLQCLKKLELYRMYNLKYLDDDDDKSHDCTELRIFPSLEVLILENLPNLEGLLKVERGEVFPCISNLKISRCPKLRLPCLPSLKDLDVFVCNSELLKSISSFCGLTTLKLDDGDGITFLPEGMFRNLVCLQTLKVDYFPNLKELPKEPFSLVMEHLIISSCDELDSLPEEIWKGLKSLRTLDIRYCEGLRCLPEGLLYLTSLEGLTISGCPTLKERCKRITGEDWYKISHIPYDMPLLFLHYGLLVMLVSLLSFIDMIGLNDESPKKAVNLNNGVPTNVIPTITNAERVTASPEPQQPQSSEGSHVHVRNIIQNGQLHSSAVEVFMIAGRPYELIENLHKLALHNLQSAKFDNTYCIKDICFCHGLSWQ
ncbi:putative disease resistance protein RGA1 [Trifolium repens]|nr:putative disease resistance protein RGA1 [Trifolium repens]